MRVATGVADSSLPAWSTDGSWLFFTGRANNTNQIFKVRPDGGTAIQLTHRGGAVPHEAPDGRRVYYVGPAGRVFFTSVEGGEEREVVGMPARAAKWTYDWAVTSQGIYFVEGDSPRPHLDWFDFATGKVHRVFDTPGRPEEWGGGLAVSPDGLRLLYSQLDGLSGDIILVEGFPP